jgi:3-keto-disaccharide hydrolase
MKRLMRIVVVSLLVGLAGFGCRSMSGGEGWVTLIDGNDGMDNWSVSGRAANWRAEGGAIQADKFNSEGKVASVLVSKRSFKDFELRVEFWAGDDTNSGVYLRAPNPDQVNTASGAYEVQIWDKNPNPKYATGSLVNVAAVEPIYKAANKWNTFEIVAKGTQITVRMNGVVTASIQDAKNTQDGRLGLQFNGGPIKFRKLMVKPL